MATNLREYLVNLGFKVDEKTLKNFVAGTKTAAKGVATLVAAVGGAALGVATGVAVFAANLEDLYFAAKKAGSTALNLKAFGQASQNFGVSADEALGSVQALARFMRETPGAEGYLASLGVQARNANGEMRDTTDIMQDVGKELAKKPYALSKQYGDLLGISEDTLRAVMTGDFAAAMAKQKGILKNSGFNKAAADAHKFMVGLRNLQTQLEVFAIQVQDALLKKFGTSLDKIGVWFEKNGPMMAARIADVIKGFLELAEKVIPAIGWLVQKFMDLDNATDGASTKAALAVAAFTLLGGASVVSGIMGVVKAVGMLGGALMSTATATSAAGITSSLGALAKSAGLLGAAATVGYAIGTAINDAFISGTDFGDWIGENVAKVLAFFGNDEAQAALDGGKKKAPSTLENIAALDGGKKKSQLTLENIAANWGKSGADLTHEAYSPAMPHGSSKSATVNQTTNININGGEAASTGKAVARSQDRVNEDIVRNLSLRVY
jgi:hypothetical protein